MAKCALKAEVERLRPFEQQVMVRYTKADEQIKDLQAKVERLRAEGKFVDYDVVRCSDPVDGKPARYHVYGITAEGIRVGLVYLYLREHDRALAQAEARLAKVVEALRATHPNPCTDAHTNAGCRVCAALAAAQPEEEKQKMERGR